MTDILKDLNRRFDHAALKSDVDEKAIIRLCDEAKEFDFITVAVNPVWVKLATELLMSSSTKVLATVGFPLGANRTDTKIIEATKAVRDGASELDMVANVGWIKSGEFDKLEKEILEIRNAIQYNVILKVIIEAPLLSSKEQIESTKAVIKGGAQFVKTCTGFFGGATVDQVKTLVRAADGKIEVKASGGIRTLKQCQQLLKSGATRLGSSSSVQIMNELKTA